MHASGSQGRPGLVHRASEAAQSGGTVMQKGQEVVKVRWWEFKRRVGRGDSELLEYKKEGAEQWLHLRTIMPVDVHLSTTSTIATLKISANEAACIDENTEWVLSQGRGGGRNKRQRCRE